MTTENENTPSRQSRDSETHEKETRRQPWRPVRKLETPPAPEGYEYRWIPQEFQLPTYDSGRHAGVVYNEGLLLAKMPIETINERNNYYAGKSQQAREALDNNVFQEANKDSRYVKYDANRKSNVTFGKK
jgi:hypothetical protein